jgi:hypothetical protein
MSSLRSTIRRPTLFAPDGVVDQTAQHDLKRRHPTGLAIFGYGDLLLDDILQDGADAAAALCSPFWIAAFHALTRVPLALTKFAASPIRRPRRRRRVTLRPEPIGRMEIVLSGGKRIIVGADVDATALARVVRTLARR